MSQGDMSAMPSLKRRAIHDGQTDPLLSSSSTQYTSHTPASVKMEQKKARAALVLWWSPLTTLYYFTREAIIQLQRLLLRLWDRKKTVVTVLLLLAVFTFTYHTEGSHQHYVQSLEKQLMWCAYWVGLGILSSVGMGTGLHTFVLYLAPHIARVTLAAYECGSLDFPEPPYPDKIMCPSTSDPDSVTMWAIMSKVRLEAFMWGFGTAIGELPPYFMAKAARLSSRDLDEDDLEEIEEALELTRAKDTSELSFIDRAKVFTQSMVQRMGFLGIMACASIPNPLFDLAGITCGHFLVSFWTFFGATAIGKGIVKMHLQKVFVIFLSGPGKLEYVLEHVKRLPYGEVVAKPLLSYLANKREEWHGTRPSGSPLTTQNSSWVGSLFEWLIILMVAYFVCSIVNSMAKSYHKRLCKARQAPHTGHNGVPTLSKQS